MNIKQFFKNTGENLLHVFKRFPVTVVCLTILTIVFLFHDDLLDTIELAGVWFLSVGTVLSLSLEVGKGIFKTRRIENTVKISAYLIHTLISLLLYIYKDSSSDEHALALISIGTCVGLAMFCLPFIRRSENDIPMWNYVYKIAKAYLIAIIFTCTLFAGLSIILLSFEYLFDIGYRNIGDFIEYLGIIHASFIFPMIIMAYIPEGDEIYVDSVENTGTVANKFIHYVILPLFGVFMFIMYLYMISIIFQWELPKGMISVLVSSAMAVMLLIYFMLYPAKVSDDNSFDKKILKWMPVLMLPLLLMMSVGIIRRVSEYGLTEARIYLILLHIWLYAICGLLIFNKSRRIIWIPVSFSLIFMAVSVLPINVFSVTRMWMHHSVAKQIEASGIQSLPMNQKQYTEWLLSLDEPTREIIAERLKHITRHSTRDSINDLLDKDVNIYYISSDIITTIQNNQIEEKPETGPSHMDSDNSVKNPSVQVPDVFRHASYKSVDDEFIYHPIEGYCKWIKFFDIKWNSDDNEHANIHVDAQNGAISFTMELGSDLYRFSLPRSEIYRDSRMLKITSEDAELILNEFSFDYIPPAFIVDPDQNYSSLDHQPIEPKPYMTLNLKGIMITK